MKITKLETIRWRQEPGRLWVRVHTDAGLIGLGETYNKVGPAKTVIHELLSNVLIGRDPRKIQPLWAVCFKMFNSHGYAGAEFRALSAIDIALWDILGQATGQPIHALLGGAIRNRLRVYNTGLFLAPDQLTPGRHPILDHAEALLAEGITAMKIDINDRRAYPSMGYYVDKATVRELLESFRQVQRHIGDAMDMIAHGHAWWDLTSALRIAKALEPFDILFLEELTIPDDEETLARLVAETRVPICVSERLFTRYAFKRLIERRAVHVLMPDLVWTGGITEAVKIAALAESYNLPLAPHNCGGAVTAFATAHAMATTPNFMLMETVRQLRDGRFDPIYTVQPEFRAGHLLLPSAPGLGTALQPAFLRRDDVEIEVSTEPSPWGDYFAAEVLDAAEETSGVLR